MVSLNVTASEKEEEDGTMLLSLLLLVLFVGDLDLASRVEKDPRREGEAADRCDGELTPLPPDNRVKGRVHKRIGLG